MNLYRKYFKRIFDILFSSILLITLSPVIIAFILILKCSKQRKAFFLQERTGLNAAIFKVIKLKTMTDEKDEYGNLLPDGKRLTKTGFFIRRNSIDELVQLINILKGDMSFVGPRPLLPKYLPLYSAEQNRRHEVRPGITGWAQVNGRNNISWKSKFEFDVWYVDNLSFWVDMKIIFLTIKKIISGADISRDGHATTETFNGNN